MNLPEKFAERLQKELGEEWDAYLSSMGEARSYGLRVNPLKISKEEFLEKGLFPLSPVPWCKNGFYYEEGVRPAKHPYYHLGLYYLQDPSAMSPGAVLPISPGERVLDLCAAPGGKTTQLGAKLGGKGLLVANDISASRIKPLIKNVELFGIRNAVIVNETPERLAARLPAFFDKILIDAPCSGEGMFRKEPDVIKSWGDKMTAFCIKEQKHILDAAAALLAPGGMLLYSTCTFAPEEDEGAIERFLQEHPDFSIVPFPDALGFDRGRPEWVAGGRGELLHCGRLWPHKIRGEGHFLCLLEKAGERAAACVPEAAPVSEKELTDYRAFESRVLKKPLLGNFQIYGEDLYLLPEGAPDLRGLRVVRSGWHLGQFKKKRFEPYQAFAMGLRMEEVLRAVCLSSKDPRTIKYLKGETIEFESEQEGYVLLCCDGFPMGWGKLLNGRIKNKYFPGWRLA